MTQATATVAAAHAAASSAAAPAPAHERPEDENLGFGPNLVYGMQHVLTMYGGIVAVPLIVAEAAGMSATDASLLITACLFMGGIATLLQTLGIPFFGSRLPLVQGVSFAGHLRTCRKARLAWARPRP